MVLHLLFTALISIAVVEVVRRLPLVRVGISAAAVARKAKWAVLARASDHWKEQAMRAYAGAMFAATGKLFVLLAIVAGVIGAMVFVADNINPGFGAFLVAPTGLMASLMLATFYGVGRARIR